MGADRGHGCCYRTRSATSSARRLWGALWAAVCGLFLLTGASSLRAQSDGEPPEVLPSAAMYQCHKGAVGENRDSLVVYVDRNRRVIAAMSAGEHSRFPDYARSMIHPDQHFNALLNPVKTVSQGYGVRYDRLQRPVLQIGSLRLVCTRTSED